MINIHTIAAYADNYIWLIEFGDRQAAVVDPGQAEPVLQTLQAKGLSLAAILITHHHWDHIDGIAGLRRHSPVPVYGPANEHIPQMDHPCQEGDHIALGELQLKVLDVPGHTAGHIAFYGHGALFCGDTLFAAGCGRLLGGTAAQLHNSLNKITELPPQTRIYCAHEYTLANLKFARTAEPDNLDIRARQQQEQTKRARGEATLPSTLALELATNPFLRCQQAALIAAVEEFAGRELSNENEVFKALRYWKDTFS